MREGGRGGREGGSERGREGGMSIQWNKHSIDETKTAAYIIPTTAALSQLTLQPGTPAESC